MVAPREKHRPEAAALNRKQLDVLQAKGCGVPGCTDPDCMKKGVFLHSRCHPTAAVDVCYDAGVIIVTCTECDKLIERIAVAEGS